MRYLHKFTVVSLIIVLASITVTVALSARLANAENNKPEQETLQSPQHIRRADFRLAGISCASCLHRITREIIATPGVIKADVSIFHPYHGVVIYNSEKTSAKKIFESVTDKTAKFLDVKESDLSEVPAVVIPK